MYFNKSIFIRLVLKKNPLNIMIFSTTVLQCKSSVLGVENFDTQLLYVM